MPLLATLPAAHQTALVRRIAAHPAVAGVRYNVGARSPFSPRETLERVLAVAEACGKPLWVDLKGRQLRITRWAVPTFGDVVLNHAIEVEGEARLAFRDGESCPIAEVRGDHLYLDPPPAAALGQGQAVNVLAERLTVHGYLTEEDEEYLEACRALGLRHLMLSFVEEEGDLAAVRARLPDVRPVLKIESRRGLELVARGLPPGTRLMAARDDLLVNVGRAPAAILKAVEAIVRCDPQAIVASRLLQGVERGGPASLGDLCDLQLMDRLGYRTFLLSDGLCQRRFEAAVEAWQSYRSVFPEEGAA